MPLKDNVTNFSNLSITPDSVNVVFYDSEFTTLDPYKGELLSVGMVRPNGEELYVEIEPSGEMSAWVKKHVKPLLQGEYVSREEAKKRISEFLGSEQPRLVCFVSQYDILYLHKLFGVNDDDQKNLPYYWMPIDMASILFSLGIDPAYYSNDNAEFFRAVGIDLGKYKQHNALDDAKLIRDVYIAMAKKNRNLRDLEDGDIMNDHSKSKK